MSTHTICHECPSLHASNCSACFGWGLVGLAPINAERAYGPPLEGRAACPECGGEQPTMLSDLAARWQKGSDPGDENELGALLVDTLELIGVEL